MLAWHCKAFDELTPIELYRILEARCNTFVVEDRTVYRDMDGEDRHAFHVFATDTTHAELTIVACARFLPPGPDRVTAEISRVLTLPDYRGRKVGSVLMRRVIAEIRERFPAVRISLNAQQDLLPFYKPLGFHKSKGPYLEDGMPYIEMRLH